MMTKKRRKKAEYSECTLNKCHYLLLFVLLKQKESSSLRRATERPTCVTQPRREGDGMGFSGKPQISQATSRNPNGGCLLPGTYEIILCVDFIETTG